MGLLDKFKKKNFDQDEKQTAPNKSKVKVGVPKKEETKKEEVIKTVVKGSADKKVLGDAYKIILNPIVSEKSTVGESLNVYTFKVALGATKVDIKNAIKQIYNVQPKKVRVVNVEGKELRSGRRIGRRQDWKKAMITLPKGQSINIHEGV